MISFEVISGSLMTLVNTGKTRLSLGVYIENIGKPMTEERAYTADIDENEHGFEIWVASFRNILGISMILVHFSEDLKLKNNCMRSNSCLKDDL